MKPRTHICLVIGMLVGFFSLAGEGLVNAQRFPDPTPFAVPSLRMPARGGLFYIQGGVRFRNVQTVRMNSLPHFPENRIEGRPGWGPPVEGAFGDGTGIPNTLVATPTGNVWFRLPDYDGADTTTWALWDYDNGEISNQYAAFYDIACEGDTTLCLAAADAWFPWRRDPDPQLGRNHTQCGGSDCGGDDTNSYIGWFVMEDPATQALDSEGRDRAERTSAGLNPVEIMNTWSIQWQRVMTGVQPARWSATQDWAEEESLIWRMQGQIFQNLEFKEKIWTPALEIGYQYTDFFDIFYGFSMFDVAPTFSRSYVIEGQAWRRAFVDTFPFFSDHGEEDDQWPVTAFTSSGDIINGQISNYHIFPDNMLRGVYPTRTFIDVRDYNYFTPTGDPPQFREDIWSRADIHVYENRLGFRSWFPLYGMGRVGFSVGAMLNYIYYRLSGGRTFTALQDSGITGPAGTVIINEADSYADWWFNYGGFFGTDVELDYNGYLAKASFDWAFCEEESAQLYSVKTEINPGGFSMLFAAGARF